MTQKKYKDHWKFLGLSLGIFGFLIACLEYRRNMKEYNIKHEEHVSDYQKEEKHSNDLINAALIKDSLKDKGIKVDMYRDYMREFQDKVFENVVDEKYIYFLEGESGVGKSTFITDVINAQRKKETMCLSH